VTDVKATFNYIIDYLFVEDTPAEAVIRSHSYDWLPAFIRPPSRVNYWTVFWLFSCFFGFFSAFLFVSILFGSTRKTKLNTSWLLRTR